MKDIIKELSKPLEIKDIDFRIQSINKGGYATILAYKDARVDMNRLDEVCGLFWQKKYNYVESANMLFCSVGIKIDDEWIWREDLGTESFSDKQKGHASDSFKRACFNWGIGRELYEYPVIQVKLNENELVKDSNGNYKASYNLKLREWIWELDYKDGSVNGLIAKDNNGLLRFNYNKIKKAYVISSDLSKPILTESHPNFLKVKEALAKRTHTIDQVKQKYQVSSEIEKLLK